MFVGRERELKELERLYDRPGFQMIVLYGRRRVGKTTLAHRFSEGKPTLSFTAKVQSNALNLAEFSSKAQSFFGLPAGTGPFSTWEDALRFVAQAAGEKRFLFIFDEFPYAAQRDESLVSVLQVLIDQAFSRTNVFLILSGSNQGFMEEHVLGERKNAQTLGEKNPLFGRRTAQIHLSPFGYRDAAKMLPGISPEELVVYYAAFGGTPYYLSAIDTSESFEANLERQFFSKEGLLYEEPMMLLRQELREPALYSSILDAIANGANRPQTIADRVGEERTSVAKYLSTLASMSLVKKRVPFGENRERSRKGIYRVAEPAFAFWYRFVQPNLDAIELDAGELAARDIATSDALPDYVGRWFEEICFQWVIGQALEGGLPISPTAFGSWWGTDPQEREQVDIDVVAANARRGELLVGECKWRNSFDETDAVKKLEHRAALLGEYRTTKYALFTKKGLAPATRVKLSDDWMCVSTADLYAD